MKIKITKIYQDPTGFTEEYHKDFAKDFIDILIAFNEFYINENIKEITITKQPEETNNGKSN